jgi:uncharacterized protein (DUF2141 family)
MKRMVFLVLIAAIAAIVVLSCEKAQEVLGITIAGNVSNAGQPVEGAFVLLVDKAEITQGFPIGNGSVTLGNGNYTIIRVEEGTYYICAVKDEDGNQQYDLGTDPIGWYGHPDSITGLTIPDSVIVTDQDISNIDIDTLYMQ